MSKDTTVIGQIVLAKRLVNSVNGNPRFDLTVLVDGQFQTMQTMSDSMVAYDVQNLNPSGNMLDTDMPLLTLTLTPAGRVRAIDRI